MRLKIEITRRLLSDSGKDRASDEPAVVQLRLVRVRIVQHNKADKLRMVGGQIAAEGNDILSFFVATFRIDFLGGARFASNGKAGDGGGGGGAAITHDTAQRIADLSGCLGRNGLAQNDRRKRAKSFAVVASNRFHYARSDQFAAIGDRRHRHGHLQWRHSDFMAHRNPCDRDFAPGLGRANQTADLTGKLDPGALTKTEAANVLIEFLLADATGEFGRADVARFDEDVLHAQLPERPMIVQRASSEIPDAILAKNHRVKTDLVLIERGGSSHNLESG